MVHDRYACLCGYDKNGDGNAVPLDVFASACQQMAQTSSDQLAQMNWHGGMRPPAAFFQVGHHDFATDDGMRDDSPLRIPFVRKLTLPPGARVAIIADLHGDVHTLDAMLVHWQKAGYLDHQGNIIDPLWYLVFTGDYVNRYQCSVPLLLKLFSLYQRNVQQVFLLRGNHEFYRSIFFFHQRMLARSAQERMASSTNSFAHELQQRFGASFDLAQLCAWFEYLPQALFLGYAQPNGSVDYVLCCHAGLEVGSTLAPFFADQASQLFLITHLHRTTVLGEIAAHIPDFDAQVTASLVALQQGPNPAFASVYQGQAINLASDKPFSSQDLRVGLVWNNFSDQQNSSVEFAASAAKRNVYLGRRASAYLLARMTAGTSHKVHAIFRGHQHLDEQIPALGLDTRMLSLIRAGNGLVRQWDGMVYTLGASHHITGVQSFVQLEPAVLFGAGRVTLYWKLPTEDTFMQHYYRLS